MWPLLLLATFQPIAGVPDYLHNEVLTCSVGSNPYHERFETCPVYQATGFLPFCVYMRTPSTETTRGYHTYGCVYSKNLPKECVERGEYYTDWATVTFRGNKTVSGAMMCCDKKYCNRVDDVMVSMVRLTATNKLNTIWVPVVAGVFLCLAALMPCFHWYTEKRHLLDSQRAEQSEAIKEDLTLTELATMVGDPTEMVQLEFEHYEEIEHVMKKMSSEQRCVATTSGTAVVGRSKTPGAAKEEKPEMETEFDILWAKKATVMMKDRMFPQPVLRLHHTKFEHLAMKMIEHGPYRYNFDPVELGELFESCMGIFKREQTLLRLRAHERKEKSELIVYGNLEGNYGDLFRWFHINGWPFKKTLIFLGGLTSSREEYSLETLVLILALKKILPHRVYILRGPSEVYPFSFKNRMPLQLANCLTEALSRTFDYLPLAALVNDTILLCHGGISKNIRHVRQIDNIGRPLKDIQMGTIAADLIFSKVGSEQRLIEGARGTCLSYDQEPLITTGQHQAHDVKLVIRARNNCPQGFMVHNDRMMTLWSSTNQIAELGAEIGSELDLATAASVTITIRRNLNQSFPSELELDLCLLVPHVERYSDLPKFETEACKALMRRIQKRKKRTLKRTTEDKETKQMKKKGLMAAVMADLHTGGSDETDGKAAAPPVLATAIVAAKPTPSAKPPPLKEEKQTQ